MTDGAGIANPLTTWTASQLTFSRKAYHWLYWSAIGAAFLTAVYTFRAFCMTFHGPERIPPQAGHHAHEAPGMMLAPLIILAVCAIGIGLAMLATPLSNWGANRLVDFLGGTPSLAGGSIAATRVPTPEFHLSVAGLSTVVALAGIVLAMYFYMGERTEAQSVRSAMDLEGLNRLTDPQWVVGLERVGWIGATNRFLRRMHLSWLVTLVAYLLGLISLVLAIPLLIGNFVTPYRLSRDKFYFDEIYAAIVVWPLKVAAAILYWFDRWIIDGLVNLLGRIPPAAGYLMRSLQMGQVQFYALAMVLGMLLLVAARLIWAAG